MVEQRESLISAHHNYLVNDMLSPGFLIGDPDSREGFFFLADVVPPGEGTPRFSGRFFDRHGRPLVEIRRGVIVENPGGCSLQSVPGGFRLIHTVGETILNVHTQVFTNGYLTRIQGRLYDGTGSLRAESAREGIMVYGDAKMALGKIE